MTDRVSLRGIVGFGHHGVYAEERRDGQRFVVDVTCEVDLAPAGAADDLALTVDYGELARSVVADIERDPVDLVETLAERVARTCLERTPVQAVDVTVHKPDALLGAEVADVAVTVRRSRR